VTYSARGLAVIFRDIFYRGQPWLLVGFLIGLGLMLLHRQWLVPALVVLLLGPPYSFLAGAPNDLFPARYAHHALPWVELILAYGIAWLLLALLARRPLAGFARPHVQGAALPGRWWAPLPAGANIRLHKEHLP
jgi:hypothetical protein